MKSIKRYSSIDNLISDNADNLFYNISDDIVDYFMHIDDFECFDYFLIDGKVYVTDNITGDVLTGPETIKSIFDTTLKSYEEDI